MPTTIHPMDDTDNITSSVLKAIFDHEQAHGRLALSHYPLYLAMPVFQIAGIRISQNTLDKWRTEAHSAGLLNEMDGRATFHEHCLVTVDSTAGDSIIVDEAPDNG